jgi:hypothetical protein
MKTLICAVGLATLIVAPAFAQSPTPKFGSGAGAGAPSPRSPRAPAQSRGMRQPSPNNLYGQRWPGARYDANGYYIDPNSPGRW